MNCIERKQDWGTIYLAWGMPSEIFVVLTSECILKEWMWVFLEIKQDCQMNGLIKEVAHGRVWSVQTSENCWKENKPTVPTQGKERRGVEWGKIKSLEVACFSTWDLSTSSGMERLHGVYVWWASSDFMPWSRPLSLRISAFLHVSILPSFCLNTCIWHKLTTFPQPQDPYSEQPFS